MVCVTLVIAVSAFWPLSVLARLLCALAKAAHGGLPTLVPQGLSLSAFLLPALAAFIALGSQRIFAPSIWRTVLSASSAASAGSQPAADAPGPSAPSAPASEAARATESASNPDAEWDALLDAHGLTSSFGGTAAAVRRRWS